jgi:predicted dehydrogenase
MFDDDGYEIETQSITLMKFQNGAQVYADINHRITYPTNDIAIFGTDGRFSGRGLTRSRFDGEMKVLTKDGETATFYPQPSGEAHGRNIAAYSKAVLAGEQPNASGIDGLHSMLLTEAIEQSAKEKRTITIDYSRLPASAKS